MEIFTTDVLILGGGLSAYMTAYTLLKKKKKLQMMIVTPDQGREAGHAVQGVSLPRVDRDSVEQFYQDVRAAGAYQNDPALARLFCEESQAVFDRIHTVTEFAQPKPGERFRPAVDKQNGLWEALYEGVQRNAEIREECVSLRLFVKDGRVQGALCYDIPGRAFFAVSAGTVVLATGGFGDLYAHQEDGGHRAIGSGVGMAYFAGAQLADLEFAWFPKKEDRPQQRVVTLGGVVIDNQCRTTLPGLFAVGGGTAGVHGAGLQPGDAEMAALVLGRRAGHTLTRMDYLPGADPEALFSWVAEVVFVGQKNQAEEYSRIRKEIEGALESGAGAVRSQERIEAALQKVAHLQHELNDLDLCILPQIYEKFLLEHALITARLALLASLEREECRGCYQRANIRLIPVEKPEAPAQEPEEAAEAAEEEAMAAEEEPAQEAADEEVTEDDGTEPEILPEEEEEEEDAGEGDLPEDEEEEAAPEAPAEPEFMEEIELIEKQVKPYRVTLQLNGMILMPDKEDWSRNAE